MKSYLSLIKFSHTVFALPFALIGLTLGYKDNGMISGENIFKVLLCMIFARSAAMAFNRWADVNYDRLNVRTSQREIPSGVISKRNALIFVILNCVAFVVTTYFINRICFYLSPVALITILGYSFTKRWTFLCHLVLGIGLSLAPIGAYLAITGSFSLLPLLYSGVVFYWVSGFDIIYALQDEEFDKQNGLLSIPSKYGKARALTISRMLHLMCALNLIFVTFKLIDTYPSINGLIILAAILFIAMLIYQHSLVQPQDLKRVNFAFFTTNGIASVVYGFIVILGLVIK